MRCGRAVLTRKKVKGRVQGVRVDAGLLAQGLYDMSGRGGRNSPALPACRAPNDPMTSVRQQERLLMLAFLFRTTWVYATQLEPRSHTCMDACTRNALPAFTPCTASRAALRPQHPFRAHEGKNGQPLPRPPQRASKPSAPRHTHTLIHGCPVLSVKDGTHTPLRRSHTRSDNA